MKAPPQIAIRDRGGKFNDGVGLVIFATVPPWPLAA